MPENVRKFIYVYIGLLKKQYSCALNRKSIVFYE